MVWCLKQRMSPGVVDLGATVGQDFLRSRRSGRMAQDVFSVTMERVEELKEIRIVVKKNKEW
jgi:hypothetical protein